jgi:hypothetical protein
VRKSNIENQSKRSQVIAVIKPDHLFLKPLEQFCRRNMEEFAGVRDRSQRIL